MPPSAVAALWRSGHVARHEKTSFDFPMPATPSGRGLSPTNKLPYLQTTVNDWLHGFYSIANVIATLKFPAAPILSPFSHSSRAFAGVGSYSRSGREQAPSAMSFGRLSGSRNLCEGDLPSAGCLVIWWHLISGFLGLQAALYQLAQLVAIVALHGRSG